MNPPKISVITPCLNRAAYIEGAIESVLAQDYPDVEHIIVDGGSTDGTLELLAQYPHLKVVSGPDRGIYDALNKGLALAQGDVIGFLNSDDLYAPDTLRVVAQCLINSEADAVVGRALVLSETSAGRETLVTFNPQDIGNLMYLVTLGSPFFNAWFFRKSVFEQIGRFNTRYRIVGDREFMLRFALNGLSYAALNTLVYQYRFHAGSLTFDITDQKFERIVNEHLEMTAALLQKRGLGLQARSLIRELRTRDTIEMVIRTIKAKELARGAHYLMEGVKYDSLWPLKFCRRTVQSMCMRTVHVGGG